MVRPRKVHETGTDGQKVMIDYKKHWRSNVGSPFFYLDLEKRVGTKVYEKKKNFHKEFIIPWSIEQYEQ